MPLKSGKSKKVISANIKELSTSQPGATRKKAIQSMVRKGMSYKEAKNKQAVAIAFSKAGISISISPSASVSISTSLRP